MVRGSTVHLAFGGIMWSVLAVVMVKAYEIRQTGRGNCQRCL